MKKPVILMVVLLAAAGWVCDGGPDPQTTGITTFFLVRHAEKASEPADDPPLTEEGRARADALAYLLHHVDLAAVYSTPYLRTEQTALPTAQEKGLDVLHYQPREDGFLARVQEEYTGRAVLIVGHSNTIPELANELAGRYRFDALDEKIYDNLFIATVSRGGGSSVLRIRFGRPTPEER